MDRVIEITRRNGVATVKLESGDILRVPSAVYLERPLRRNQPVDGEAYRAFVQEHADLHALEAAMKYLALRERSRQEVRDRLRRSSYGEDTIGRVLETLERHHLVSDARFAEAWAHSRARKYGRGRIAQELRSKGVSGPEAQSALEAIPEEEEYRRCLEQAQKLRRRFRNDPIKIAQSLTRKGYHWRMAKTAAEEAVREKMP